MRVLFSFFFSPSPLSPSFPNPPPSSDLKTPPFPRGNCNIQGVGCGEGFGGGHPTEKKKGISLRNGPSGPRTPEESEKSPERVYPGTGPQKSRKSAPRSPKRVRKESKSQVSDSFRTLLGLRGALFRDFWGPVPGYSFGTLFGSLNKESRLLLFPFS